MAPASTPLAHAGVLATGHRRDRSGDRITRWRFYSQIHSPAARKRRWAWVRARSIHSPPTAEPRRCLACGGSHPIPRRVLDALKRHCRQIEPRFRCWPRHSPRVLSPFPVIPTPQQANRPPAGFLLFAHPRRLLQRLEKTMTNHPKLTEVVEKTEAKFLSRYVVPALVFLLLVAAGFGWRAIMTRLDTLSVNDSARSTDISEIKSDIRVLNTRLDMGVIKQVDSNRTTLDDHEKRIQRLERAVRVP